MDQLSKVCDTADWFDAEYRCLVRDELREPARLHRKQWEFAMITLVLQRYGLLKPDKMGLSMGGGTERVLYAIASHVRHLVVTDLYDPDTDWICARTPDPNQLIRENKPFEIDEDRVRAYRMDMRQLEFEESAFDFCYSSCAIEHIGEYNDMLQHLNEVHRVLKEGGIYVLTTEFLFGEESVCDPGQYIFSADYLRELLSGSRLAIASQPDCRITPHTINHPFPPNMSDLCYVDERGLSKPLMDVFPHVILLRGKYPFTSLLLVLRKNHEGEPGDRITFTGREDSYRFLESGLTEYRRWLKESTLYLNPFSAMGVLQDPGNTVEQFIPRDETSERNTVFHTDYFWFGSGEMRFAVSFLANPSLSCPACTLQLRIHRIATLSSRTVECVKEVELSVREDCRISETTSIHVEDDYCYAVVGKVVSGECRFGSIQIVGRS